MSNHVDFAREVHVLKASDHVDAGGLQMTGGAAISAATLLETSDSGNTFLVSQASAYAITLPAAGDLIGCRYKFVLGTTGSHAVTIGLSGATASFVSQINNNSTLAHASGGTTITFVATTAVAGDWVEVEGISASFVHVRAGTGATGGITIA